MLKNTWKLLMDEDTNPLIHLPKMIRFQLMLYLSIMWCFIFSIWTGWMVLFVPSIFIHAIILIGIFFTSSIFEHRKKTHRDLYKDTDGCVRYDDLWGG